MWPPSVPAVVLAEALTGDPRRDFHTNHVLKVCVIHPIDESLARDAAALRTITGRADAISATGAIVAAVALRMPDPVVLTSDAPDLAALAEASHAGFRVVQTQSGKRAGHEPE